MNEERYQLGVVVMLTGGLMGVSAAGFSALGCFGFDPLAVVGKSQRTLAVDDPQGGRSSCTAKDRV